MIDLPELTGGAPVPGGRLNAEPGGEHTLTIDLGGDDVRTIRRTTTDPVLRVKAQRPSQPRKAAP